MVRMSKYNCFLWTVKKKIGAILERQLQNNIEELILVMKINNCVRAVILSTCMFFKCYELSLCVFRVENLARSSN